MFLNIITFLIMLLAFIDYKRAFLIYLIFQTFWFPNATLLEIGKLSSLAVSPLMVLFFSALYVVKKKKLNLEIVRFPYIKPFWGIVFSLIFTSFVALADFLAELATAFSQILQFVVLPYLIWKIVVTDKDFSYVLKELTIVMFFAGIYGIFEYTIQANPFLEMKYELSSVKISNYNDNVYSLMERGYRIYSIFEHPIGAGLNFSLYAAFLLVFIINYATRTKHKQFMIVTVILCIVCILLTKMRSSLLFFLIILLSVVNFKKKKFYHAICLCVILGIFSWPYLNDTIMMYINNFSVNALLSGQGGSSATQRMQQLAAVSHLLSLSPAGGLGEKFASEMANSYTSAALGFESVWFEQMSRHGYIGVIAYFFLMYYMIIIVPNRFKCKELRFMSLAYWIVYTMTSIPYFRYHLFYILMFYHIKHTRQYIKYRWKTPIQN